MKTIVNYYDPSATRIVRSREYPSFSHARRAMARAAKRHVIAALAGTRLAIDPPTVHH
jgi:hypothetical protein